jgi:hypothetical protein
MNTLRLRRCVLIIALIPATRSAVAQHAAPPLARLESPSDTTRMRAFYEMVSAADDRKNHPDWPRTRFLAERAKSDDRVAVALTGLLDHENADALVQVIHDPTSPNRGPAIEALIPLSNEEIRPVMETIVAKCAFSKRCHPISLNSVTL